MRQRARFQLSTMKSLAASCALAATTAIAHADPTAQAVVVDIDIASTPADAAQVRGAIEKELSAPTITVENAANVKSRGTLKVRLERSKSTLAVTWTDDHGSSVSRTVPSNGDVASVASSSARLAGNLVRDQTCYLLSTLQPAAAPPKTEPVAAEP